MRLPPSLLALCLVACVSARADSLVQVTITGTRHSGERPIFTTFSFDPAQLLPGSSAEAGYFYPTIGRIDLPDYDVGLNIIRFQTYYDDGPTLTLETPSFPFGGPAADIDFAPGTCLAGVPRDPLSVVAPLSSTTPPAPTSSVWEVTSTLRPTRSTPSTASPSLSMTRR